MLKKQGIFTKMQGKMANIPPLLYKRQGLQTKTPGLLAKNRGNKAGNLGFIVKSYKLRLYSKGFR